MKRILYFVTCLMLVGCSTARQTSSPRETERIPKPWEVMFVNAYAKGDLESLVNCALKYPESSELVYDRIIYEYDPYCVDYDKLLGLIEKASGDTLLVECLTYYKIIQEDQVTQEIQDMSLSEVRDYYFSNPSKSAFITGILMNGVSESFSQGDYYYVRTIKDLFEGTELSTKIDPMYLELRDTLVSRIEYAVDGLSEYEQALVENCRINVLDEAETMGIDFVMDLLEFATDKKMPRKEAKIRERIGEYCSKNLPTRKVGNMITREVTGLYETIAATRNDFLSSVIQTDEISSPIIEPLDKKWIIIPSYSVGIEPFIKYSEASNRVDWNDWIINGLQIAVTIIASGTQWGQDMSDILDIEELQNLNDFSEKQLADIEATVKMIVNSVSTDMNSQNKRSVNRTFENISNSLETSMQDLEQYLYDALL